MKGRHEWKRVGSAVAEHRFQKIQCLDMGTEGHGEQAFFGFHSPAAAVSPEGLGVILIENISEKIGVGFFREPFGFHPAGEPGFGDHFEIDIVVVVDAYYLFQNSIKGWKIVAVDK